MIADLPWVDGMHDGSEVTGYFTRYMVTVREKVAVLVTFSAHKEHFSKYSEDFRMAIDSLRVTTGGTTDLRWVANPKMVKGLGRDLDSTGIGVPMPIGSDHTATTWEKTLLIAKHTKGLMAILLIAMFGGAVFWIATQKKQKPAKALKGTDGSLIRKSRPIRQG